MSHLIASPAFERRRRLPPPHRRPLRSWVARAAATALLLAGPSGAHAEPGVASTTPEPPTTVPMHFDVDGAAEVRTGIRGRVSIVGTFDGRYDPVTGTFTGSFALTPTRAHVKVLGILPVVAETDWIFSEPVTGAWRDGVLSMRAAVRIRHPRLLAFGNVVVAGGGRCATRQPSVIELQSSSAEPVTDPLAGGLLRTSGKGFTISSLAGCGVLDGLLSAVAAGSGNHATVRLSTPQLD